MRCQRACRADAKGKEKDKNESGSTRSFERASWEESGLSLLLTGKLSSKEESGEEGKRRKGSLVRTEVASPRSFSRLRKGYTHLAHLLPRISPHRRFCTQPGPLFPFSTTPIPAHSSSTTPFFTTSLSLVLPPDSKRSRQVRRFSNPRLLPWTQRRECSILVRSRFSFLGGSGSGDGEGGRVEG